MRIPHAKLQNLISLKSLQTLEVQSSALNRFTIGIRCSVTLVDTPVDIPVDEWKAGPLIRRFAIVINSSLIVC